MKPFNAKERLLLESCPRPSNGVHDWTYRVLCMLARRHPSDSELFYKAKNLFRLFANRTVQDREIIGQIPNTRRHTKGQWGQRNGSQNRRALTTRSAGLPVADLGAIEKIVRAGATLSELIKHSPVPVDGGAFAASQILEVLFPGDPLLCCGWEKDRFDTRRRTEWHDLGRMQFIVPSPMARVRGITRDGEPSTRCLDNTGPRRFLVVEFDFSADGAPCGDSPAEGGSSRKGRLVRCLLEEGFSVSDMCAALIWHLARLRKLALVVHSGGKSLHGWFYCEGENENSVRAFMNEAVRLGADKATWSPCQLVRMPEGTRNDDTRRGIRQAVRYFNPSAVPMPH